MKKQTQKNEEWIEKFNEVYNNNSQIGVKRYQRLLNFIRKQRQEAVEEYKKKEKEKIQTFLKDFF